MEWRVVSKVQTVEQLVGLLTIHTRVRMLAVPRRMDHTAALVLDARTILTQELMLVVARWRHHTAVEVQRSV